MRSVGAASLGSAVTALLLAAGASQASAPSGRYVASSGTVLDGKTKLTWQLFPSTTTSFTWGSSATAGTAQSYCASLSANGGGWRLPTLNELLTLVDYSQDGGATPMIDQVYFPLQPSTMYWTATPVASSPGYAWLVDFKTGSASGLFATSTKAAVRCVR